MGLMLMKGSLQTTDNFIDTSARHRFCYLLFRGLYITEMNSECIKQCPN